jgi:hypothetical protein
VVAVLLLGALAVLDSRMRAAGGPGLLDFEFAGTAARVRRAVGEWGASGTGAARWAQIVDCAFVLVYAPLLRMAARRLSRRAARRRRDRLAAVGPAVAAVPIVAGAFDLLENGALLTELSSPGGATAPRIAAASGIVTSSLLALTLLYLLVAGLAPPVRSTARPPT